MTDTTTNFDMQAAAALIEQQVALFAAQSRQPAELYEPIAYLLGIGGKRARPLLALMGCHLAGGSAEQALPVAMGVEVFHNFTLMHDDIMDQAPLRRGQQTVHERWGSNVAILSGDVMLVQAYELLESLPAAVLPAVLMRFNRVAAQVCEGQQLDMNFERREQVQEQEYVEMIRLKTAVLLGYALQAGALVGGADAALCEQLRLFGEYIGIGFQLKDDLLDVYGEQQKVGKQVGGDIIANKKTYLLIKALELARGQQAQQLQGWLQAERFDKQEKVAAVRDLYDQLGVQALAEGQVKAYFDEAFALLEAMPVPEERKAPLRAFAQALIGRDK